MKYNFSCQRIVKGLVSNMIIIISILIVSVFISDIQSNAEIWTMVITAILFYAVMAVILFYRFEHTITINSNNIEIKSFGKKQIYPFNTYKIVSLGYVYYDGKSSREPYTLIIQNTETKENEAFVRICSKLKKYQEFEELLHKRQVKSERHKTAQYDFFFQEAKNDAIHSATYVAFSLIGPGVKVGKKIIPMEKGSQREVLLKEVTLQKIRNTKASDHKRKRMSSKAVLILPHASLVKETELLIKYRLAVVIGKVSTMHDIIVSVNMNYQDIYKIGELNRLFYIIQNKM